MNPPDCEQLYSDGRHYDGIVGAFADDIPFYLSHNRPVR